MSARIAVHMVLGDADRMSGGVGLAEVHGVGVPGSGELMKGHVLFRLIYRGKERVAVIRKCDWDNEDPCVQVEDMALIDLVY